MKLLHFILLAVLCLVYCHHCPGAGCSPPGVLVHRPWAIGTFYNGTTLTATGSIPSDSEAIVRFIGAPAEVHMKKKGKSLGCYVDEPWLDHL